MTRQPYDAAIVACFFENEFRMILTHLRMTGIDLSDPEPTGDALSDDDQSDLETTGRVPTSDGLSDPETTIGVLSDKYSPAPMDTEPPFLNLHLHLGLHHGLQLSLHLHHHHGFQHSRHLSLYLDLRLPSLHK